MSISIIAIALSGLLFAFNAAVCARMFFEFGRVDYIIAAALMAIFSGGALFFVWTSLTGRIL